jgi:hypothetical protein
MNFEIFDKNSIIFWTSGTIKMNLGKIKQINQGSGLNQGVHWVQLGDIGQSGYHLSTRKGENFKIRQPC